MAMTISLKGNLWVLDEEDPKDLGQDIGSLTLSLPSTPDISAGAGGETSAAGAGSSQLTPLTLNATHYDITGDRNIDAVLIGSKWNTLSQTFSFPTDGAFYVGYTTGENVNGFSAFNAAQQNAARYGL